MTDSIRLLEEKITAYNAENGERIAVLRDEPMAKHTSFKIGGAARLYLIPKDTDALIALCGFAKETGARTYLLGNGSNVLFDDAGFDGAVISTSALNQVEVCGTEITAQAGASLASVCHAAKDNGLTGLEFAYGIPGSVGGAVTMNAGAYDGEIAFVLEESTYLDPDDLSVHTLSLEEHHYGYRESVYKHHDRVILSAKFKLREGNRDEIAAKMNDFMNRRVSKQPLEYPSAGSVFKRAPGHYTGQMIEESGLKGYTIGGAQVSEKHAGFIINRGGATSADVLALVEHIREVIRENYGVELECEIIHVK